MTGAAKLPRYEPGSFCWVGLATSDPAGAKAFYASLLGWQAEDPPAGSAGDYTLLRRNGLEVAILYQQTAEARRARATPHWTTFVSVADAEATAAQAAELGGAAVFRAPFDVLDEGRVAAIRDPLGAILSVWQPRTRAGAAVMNEEGALCWSELVTTDLERAQAFYHGLFGWEFGSADGGHEQIESAGQVNGSMRLPADHEGTAPPAWLPYFMVENVNRSAAAAEQALGNRLESIGESGIGRLATLADPQGARFGILEPR
jgi:predicted enzyme related to lactoylglutathione lyase